jgi:hypothetical protein
MTARNLFQAAFAATVCAALTSLARGQPHEAPPNDTVFFFSNGPGAAVAPFRGKIDLIAGAGSLIGEVVTGKPYSAESVTESTQVLNDGNRITQTNRSKIYRDSQGRSRLEQIIDSVGVWQSGQPVTIVTINDPVKDVSYFLDPRAQTAREFQPFRLKLENLPPGAEPPAGVAVHRWVRRARDGASVGNEVRATPLDHFDVELSPAPPPPLPGQPAIAYGAVASYAGADVEATTEELGEQVLEGVLARGTRRTHTIPAGAIGNELPIAIVHEEWYSPDLETVVLRRHTDPRFGETTYRLINVDRSEPAPELFTVPDEYDVERGGPSFGRGFEPAPAPGERTESRVFLVRPGAAPAQQDAPKRSDD